MARCGRQDNVIRSKMRQSFAGCKELLKFKYLAIKSVIDILQHMQYESAKVMSSTN